MISKKNMQSKTQDELILYYNSQRQFSIHSGYNRGQRIKGLQRSLKGLIQFDSGVHILDIGCGDGALLSLFRQYGFKNLDGFDASPENISECHRAGFPNVSQHDALNLGSYGPSKRYDVICCLDVLEHLPKEGILEFLQNVHKLLSDDGRVIFQTPNMGSLFSGYHLFGDLTHEFGLTENSARQLFTLAGFGNEKLEIRPCWNSSSFLGAIREVWMRTIHYILTISLGSSRPRIATPNLIIVADK